MPLRLTLALAFMLAACGPSIKPAMQAATDQKLASYSSQVNLPAPTSYAPREWKPGQWVAMRTTQPGKPPAVTLIKILSKDASGFWVETENQDYYQRSISKVLYARMPRTADDAMDAVVKIISKQDDEPVQEIDFATHPMAPMMKAAMRYVSDGISAPTDVSGAAKELVTVPAGTFAGAARFTGTFSIGPISKNVIGWFHPAVPVNGSVKSVTTDGDVTTELLAFGEDGAVSALK